MMIDFKQVMKGLADAEAAGENTVSPAFSTALEEELEDESSSAPVAAPTLFKNAVPDEPEKPAPVPAKPQLVATPAPEEAKPKEAPLPPVSAANDRQTAKVSANMRIVDFALSQFHKSPSPDETQEVYTSRQAFKTSSFTAMPEGVLKTACNDMTVAEGMVALAIKNGWSPIRAAGTDEFKANIFFQAVRMGVEVSGYTPTPADLDRLAKSRVAIPAWIASNSILPANATAPRSPSPGM